MVVIVKAFLNIDSSRNTVLHNAETQVSVQRLRPFKNLIGVNGLMPRGRACFQVRLTVFPERLEAQYGGVPWWIIVLTILLLLLLLGLLAFLLWKVRMQRNPCSAN